MTARQIGAAVIGLLAGMQAIHAQTQIDLASQTKNVDFSGAASTKPNRTGPALPSVCSVGDTFFETSAPAGQNLYGCTTANTWSLLGGGGSAGGATAAQLGDFMASNSSATVQTIGGTCSSATPCQIRIGTAGFIMTAPVTLTLSGVNTNGNVFWYLSSSLVLTAGYSSAATLTCSAGCVTAPGVTSFPPDSIPLWLTTFTANTWAQINLATMDKRSLYSRDIIAPGSGISSLSNPASGVQTLSTDPTTVPRYFGGSGPPSGTCAAGRDFYTDSANLNLYFCAAANNWKQASSAYSAWLGQTAALTMNGSDLPIFSSTIPALALGPGQCLEMQFGNIHSGGGGAITAKLALGSTSIPLLTSADGTPWIWHFLWCNNPGSRSAQQLTAYPVVLGTGFSNLSVSEISATAVDTTQAFPVTFTVNGPSGNTETGTFWRLRVTQ